MPLQTSDLSMLALSVLNDSPPNSLQPALADGIHLRWAFEKSKGFPWFGFYLFRRTTASYDRSLKSIDFSSLSSGNNGYEFQDANGLLRSDAELSGTDDFPSSGDLEVSLNAGTYVEYVPSDVANEVRLTIGFRQSGQVILSAYLGGVPIGARTVTGAAGAMEAVTLTFDALSSLRISSADAALINIGFMASSESALAGWQPLAGFPSSTSGQPYCLTLPVAHSDYTAPGKPSSATAAEQEALARVKYGLPAQWATGSFQELHSTLSALVQGGHAGATMASKELSVASSPAGGPTMPAQSPLELVLLGSLHIGLAQMLGLAWVDESAASTPDTDFDYLLVADHSGVLRGDAQDALNYLRSNGFTGVDAYIVYKKRVNDAAPALKPPSELRLYSLPGGASTSGGATQVTHAVGLRWPLGTTGAGVLLPDKPILYEVWRAELGNGATPWGGASFAHRTTSGPVLVVGAESHSAQANPPSDWPPVRLHFIDSGLVDGWYGYKVSGIDVFGRHSHQTSDGAWYQWKPAPSPLPWYYQAPASNAVVHNRAVRVLDKQPPPAPVGLEAWVLDADDPLLVKDAAYDTWRNTLGSSEQALAGLRVKWLWPQSHMDQAPDTREFRLYAHSRRRNTLLGSINSITAASTTETTVVTDIALATPAPAEDAYVGARLQVGNDAFAILASSSTSPLTLRVRNIGPSDARSPAAGTACSIVVPEFVSGATGARHPLYEDPTTPANWDQRYFVIAFPGPGVLQLVPVRSQEGAQIDGTDATVAGTVVTLDGSADISGSGVLGSFVELTEDTVRTDKLYRIRRVDPANNLVELDGAPALSTSPTEWRIVRKQYAFDVLFPLAGDTDRIGSPLSVSSANPLAYGSVGVSAADDKQHSSDLPQWTGRWGNRYGNESPVAGPATIYEVFRGKPSAPSLPAFTTSRLYASRADYHGRSFFTFRWLKPPVGEAAQILRALDDSLFATDWLIRQTRAALSRTDHADLFFEAWTDSRKDAAALQLNALSAASGYSALSQDARDVLARLPGNEGFVWGAGLAERDWDIRRTRESLSPSATADVQWFPVEWRDDSALSQEVRDARTLRRTTAVNALNALSVPTQYAALSDDALRLLAGLPANEAAFAQLTIEPILSDAATAADMIGPDNESSYVPSASLRAFVDSLNGRSSSRYFYRALVSNAVHTRGDLSLATPPVYFHDVVAPQQPRWAGAELIDNGVILRWSAGREPDLREYKIYKAQGQADAQDIRTMVPIGSVGVFTAPDSRPRQFEWRDESLVAGTKYFFRIVASDTTGNLSAASEILVVVAVDARPPKPPDWQVAKWQLLRDYDGTLSAWTSPPNVPTGYRAAILVGWQSDVLGAKFVVSRQRDGERVWRPVETPFAQSAPGVFELLDFAADPTRSTAYRVLVIAPSGSASVDFNPVFVPPAVP